jgi:energy-coupling factor transport system permease protein
MQDPRIRTISGIILSLAAFVSIPGAAAAFIWWLIFTPVRTQLKRMRLVIFFVSLIALFSFLLELTTGGGGLSYFIRMMVIILIGMWMYTEYQPGDFLDFGVWLFGDRIGFELGMLADMGMQNLSSLSLDFERIRLAAKLKGIPWSIHNLVPAVLVLVHGALMRAENTAELLAIRGFSNGGTLKPEFSQTKKEIFAGVIVLGVGFIASFPVSAFFILS